MLQTGYFRLSQTPIDGLALTREFGDASAGALVSFAGLVRNRNLGRAVQRLDYQAYVPLAEAEGERIVVEAGQRFAIVRAVCVHRLGALILNDMAVWVGVSAAHRDVAFEACRHIIDEVKARVPIWKNEHYADGESGWLHPDNSPVDSR